MSAFAGCLRPGKSSTIEERNISSYSETLIMSRAPIGRPTEILLVEDNLDDARVTIQALKHENIHCRVSLVRDGEEALSFLRREGVFAQTPEPDVILLDMELPKKDGRQVLCELRGDQRLQSIPVLVLTASAVHRAVLQRRICISTAS